MPMPAISRCFSVGKGIGMDGFLLNDRYQLEDELGRGGMGVVYRATDTLLERAVAVKIVSNTDLGTEGASRLLQEAQAAARLNHPNIVAVYDVGRAELPGETNPVSYIVMELIDGRTFKDYSPMDLDEAVDLSRHICEALAIAHEQGIIHRDLKPENVILTTTSTVKLMDFGLARIVGKTRMTQQGTFMGTISYLAPEIILGQDASAQSDLYALGVMLYELAAGRPPFEGADLTAVISQHLHAPVVPPSAYNEQISPALDHLIVHLLNKRPEDRPESAGAVVLALDQMTQLTNTSQMPVPISQLDRLVRGRMIGREQELSQAIGLWQRSMAGQGQLLLISGEPGIGKTRMVRELTAYGEISGGKVIVGYCYAQERTPYGPIAQMVQTSMERWPDLDLPQEVMADLLTLVPELRLSFPGVPPNQRLDPETEQKRLFDSIITWFGALIKSSALMLVVDDIHWADSGSLALLHYLVRRLTHRNALVVATYREVELDQDLPFFERLRDINRERLATRIKLTRLSKEQTKELLETLFAEDITPDFLNGIYQETEGNPFFIEEVCKALVDTDRLYYAGGHWNRPDVEELEIPQSIQVTIQSRLNILSRQEQLTLQIAALLGRDFEYEMLTSVSDLEEDTLIDVLEKAERAQLIEELYRSGPAVTTDFTFTHALIHSTLLTNLSTLRRHRLQRQVALSLEEAYPDRLLELAPLLGRYFAEAGDGQKAVQYLLQAGDEARQVYAYDEAIDSYEQALLFLKETGDYQNEARTLMKLAMAYHNNLAFDKSREAYDEGFAAWQRVASLEVVSGDELPPAPHPLRIASTSIPPTLDPSFCSDGYSDQTILQLFATLLELTSENELIPDIAQAWEVLDDGTRYIFHLRDDVKWSDGTPVTAGDFEYSWKRTLSPQNQLGLPTFFYDIKGAQAYNEGREIDAEKVGVKAKDELTLVVDLERSSGYFLQVLALSVSCALPRQAIMKWGSAWTDPDKIVTNGSFNISSSSTDSLITLGRNPNYHGRRDGNVSQVNIIIASAPDLLPLYEQDRLDFIQLFTGPYEESYRAIQRHPEEYLSGPYPSTSYIAFDTRQPPFADPNVRQAMALAFDREYLVSQGTRGTQFPALGGLIPPGIPGHLPEISVPYNLELARKKMSEAGYPDGQGFPQINMLIPVELNMEDLIASIADQWQQHLGIQLSIELVDYSDFMGRYSSEPASMWPLSWGADYPDPDSFLRVASWLPMSGWRHPGYDALVQNARGLTDQAERMAMYRQAEQILVDEAPIIPLSYNRYHLLKKPWVLALPLKAPGGLIIKDIIIEAH